MTSRSRKNKMSNDEGAIRTLIIRRLDFSLGDFLYSVHCKYSRYLFSFHQIALPK